MKDQGLLMKTTKLVLWAAGMRCYLVSPAMEGDPVCVFRHLHQSAWSDYLGLEHNLSPREVVLSGGRQAEPALPTYTTEETFYKGLPAVSISVQSLVPQLMLP